MKRVFILALFACACGLYAQTVDTTICAVLKSPQSFDGKIVRIKGTVVVGFDQFIVKDPSTCGYQVDGIWLSYPQGTKGKAGPVAVVQVQPAHNFAGTYTAPTRTAVTLDKSKDFKQFDSLLSQIHSKGAGMCLGCTRYEVSATLVGRLDGVADTVLHRDKAGKIVSFGGFGNMNAYPARLVLQSVSDITSKEVDFSKSDEATKSETAPFAGNNTVPYDPIAVAQKAAAVLAGSAAGDQAVKDVAVFGKQGEHNGIAIISVTANEASAEQGAKDSPDGILYNCFINMNRLEGAAQARAIIHMGQHISDLRNTAPGNEGAPLFIREYNAWTMTAAAALASGQKSLTLPGGYLLWNSSWPPQDRNNMMAEALNKFLADEAALSK